MEFSRQAYWNGLPFPSPGDLPDPGIKPGSPTFQADALLSEPPGKPSAETVPTRLKANKLHLFLFICLYQVLVAACMIFELWHVGLLPRPGIKPRSPALQADSLPSK